MLRSLLALSLLYCTTATTLAQSAPTPPPPTVPALKSVTDWPSPNRFPAYGHDLQVITVARPGVRQRCSLREIDEDSLVCLDRNLNHIVYHQDEIATVIDPRYHGDRQATIIGFGIFAALLAGSFFVPLGWSITLRFFAGYTLFALPWLVDEGIDHAHDTLLYQRPNTTLTVHLH
jgi:hypothetical protein